VIIFAPIVWTPLLVISVVALAAIWLWGELVTRPRVERETRDTLRGLKNEPTWGPGR
jgi:hypothetical protein